jgi:hypothetical protein
MQLGLSQLLVTIQAASNLTGACRTQMVRLSSEDALLLEKRRSNCQGAEWLQLLNLH